MAEAQRQTLNTTVTTLCSTMWTIQDYFSWWSNGLHWWGGWNTAGCTLLLMLRLQGGNASFLVCIWLHIRTSTAANARWVSRCQCNSTAGHTGTGRRVTLCDHPFGWFHHHTLSPLFHCRDWASATMWVSRTITFPKRIHKPRNESF